jgi:hypothetical protein
MSVASIALVFAQFDLIMIRLVVDLLVNQYTIRRYLKHKSHDAVRYHDEFFNEEETHTETDTLQTDATRDVPRPTEPPSEAAGVNLKSFGHSGSLV